MLIAMRELFNNINELKEPMANRLFDFILCHISQLGGITPAMNVDRLREWYNAYGLAWTRRYVATRGQISDSCQGYEHGA